MMEKSIVSSPIKEVSPLSGGSISEVLLATLEDQSKIILKKVSQDMLNAEAEGLKALAQSKTIPVPQVLFLNSQFLVLEYLPPGHPSSESWFELGRCLANLHLQDQKDQYGFHHNNFIGRTPQNNTNRSESWSHFFINERLSFQVKLAGSPELEALFDKKKKSIEKILSDPSISPSLIHGDLWSGNAYFIQNGLGYVIDPAVYYGDGEADLAMTELFGGFPSAFYSGYESLKPLSKDYPIKKQIYNLYHIINHYNLFGGGYLNQAMNMVHSL